MATSTVPSAVNPNLLLSLLQDEEGAALYQFLNSLGLTLNALLTQATANDPNDSVMPTGPRNVTVVPVGTTFQVQWQDDKTPGSKIDFYRVYRAAAGNRNAPTSPTFDAATSLGTQKHQDVSCGGDYALLDRNISITDVDPANPSRFAYWVTSVDTANQESIAISAGDPVEVLPNGPGDQSNDWKGGATANKLWNAGFHSSAVSSANVNIGQRLNVQAVANTTPIGITTTTNHGMSSGDQVYITGTTVFAANGYFTITSTGATTFTLNGTAASGTSGVQGNAYPVVGQGTSPQLSSFGITDNFAVNYFSPWYWVNGVGAPQFVSNTVNETREVVFPASLLSTPGQGVECAQDMSDAAYPRPITGSIHYTFAAMFKAPITPTGMSITVTGNGNLPNISVPASILTTQYTRLVWNWSMPSSGARPNIHVSVRLDSGTAKDIYMTQPILVIGDTAPPFSAIVDTSSEGNTTQSFAARTPPWGRETETTIVRDASAPYV